MKNIDIASYIDATILKSTAAKNDILNLCKQALEYNFASVCVSGQWVPLCAQQLQNCTTKVCATIGFPLGHQTTEAKVFEAQNLIQCGASEIDMVVSLGSYFSHNYADVKNDIAQVHNAVISEGIKVKTHTLLKVILETCYLSDEDIIKLCHICVSAGAEFVKTSTGFASVSGKPNGATVEHVTLMSKTVGTEAKVKAAGGIRDYQSAKTMITAGASRIGTSAGVDIVKGLQNDESFSKKDEY